MTQISPEGIKDPKDPLKKGGGRKREIDWNERKSSLVFFKKNCFPMTVLRHFVRFLTSVHYTWRYKMGLGQRGWGLYRMLG